MADINIQRKKARPNPWILVLLAAVVVAVVAYFLLRPEPADEAAPANSAVGAASADTTASVAATQPSATSPAVIAAADSVAQTQDAEDYSPATLATQAATNPAAPNYAVNGLQKLTGVLVALADRDDLRDPTVAEQRDNLTSATSRLGEPNSSPRAGFVAAAGLIRAMQQKAYPDLEGQANDLVRLAGQLSGRSATAADQQLNKQFLTQAAATVRVLSEPAH
ncbi:MAG: hypothetical protein JWR44_1186 [Hymenobacter sp.]|jgi:hypothetical protein|nr:hypothetical protein [Hymenobacter sp.]